MDRARTYRHTHSTHLPIILSLNGAESAGADWHQFKICSDQMRRGMEKAHVWVDLCIHISVYACLCFHTDILTSASLAENAIWWSEMQQNPWEIDKEVHKQIKLWVSWEGSKTGCYSAVKTHLCRLGSCMSSQFLKDYSPKAFCNRCSRRCDEIWGSLT